MAAALGAAFPNIADSTAVTGSSSLLHGSLNDVSSFGPVRPQWVDEIFIDVSSSFQDWELKLNIQDDTHTQPSIFTRAVDLFTADMMRMYRRASEFFGHGSRSEDSHPDENMHVQKVTDSRFIHGPEPLPVPALENMHVQKVTDSHFLHLPELLPVPALERMPSAPPKRPYKALTGWSSHRSFPTPSGHQEPTQSSHRSFPTPSGHQDSQDVHAEDDDAEHEWFSSTGVLATSEVTVISSCADALSDPKPCHRPKQPFWLGLGGQR